MDIHIDRLSTKVTAIDPRGALSPDVLDTIVTQVLARLERRSATQRNADDDTALWTSVRRTS
ncbi:MAG: hypothetical protein V9E89_05035 [Ilumatobacteraceae bacterium]|jgi:hypothetical protein